MASALMAPEKRHLSDAEQNGYSHYETWLAHYTLWNWSDTVSDEFPEGGTKSDWTQETHDLYQEWQEYGDDNDSLQEWIADSIRDSALSVEVRTGWYQVGVDDGEPEEFRIVFSTGGPHMELRGKLAALGNFSYMQLLVMQWGEPLHEIAQGINVEVLEFVAGQFYFDC